MEPPGDDGAFAAPARSWSVGRPRRCCRAGVW
jgi:hypothetical protein